jgi:hypothetical protein
LLLSLDSFYRPLTAEEKDDIAGFNFDVPSAFDYPLLLGKGFYEFLVFSRFDIFSFQLRCERSLWREKK